MGKFVVKVDEHEVPWERTFPSCLGVIYFTHVLRVEKLHFSMGFWGPRVRTLRNIIQTHLMFFCKWDETI